MATYPGGIFSVSTHNTGDTIQPADVNNCENEINAVETGLLNGFQHNLIPNADDTYSLGSSTNRYLKLWSQDADIDGTVTLGSALGVASGGTGGTTLTAHGVLLGEGASAIGATAAGTSGQFLVSGGASADPTWATRGVLDRSTTEQDVVNTNTETSVYSFSVPGGTLGSSSSLRLTLTGYINATGTSHNLNIRVKWGGTVIAAGNFTITTTTVGGFTIVALINANGATNSQRSVVSWILPVLGVNTVDAAWSADTGVSQASHSSLAIDSTTAQTLQVTFQWDTGDANNHAKRWLATTELLN